MKASHSLPVTGAGTLLVLALTLWPSGAGTGPQSGFWCLFCDTRDVADALLNLLLFIPFGAGISALLGPAAALGASFGLSGLVELLQTTLAGRYPSLEDLIFNTAGGLIGALLMARSPRLIGAILRPSKRTRSCLLLFPLGVYFLSALLTWPRAPERGLWGQWAHRLGAMVPYDGKILSAHVGDIPIPDGRVPEEVALRRALNAREPIRVSFVAGRQRTALSHIFAVYDDRQEEVFLIAVQGPDLLFQQRTFSETLLLDQPSMGWRGGLGVLEGDTIEVAVLPIGTNRCLQVAGRDDCTTAMGVEGGWMLLHHLGGVSDWLKGLVGVLWLSLLSFPGGVSFLPKGRRELFGVALLGLGTGAVGAFVSWGTPWLAFHAVQLWGPMLGVVAGAGARVLLSNREEPGASSLRNVASMPQRESSGTGPSGIPRNHVRG